MSLTLLILLICFALTFEGFFSGTEMAFISVDRVALLKSAQAGNNRARLALNILREPEKLLATTLVGTNLCITFQATISTIFIYKFYGPEYEFYSVVALSPIILVFGEILPKTFFQRYAEVLVPHLAAPILLARRVFTPAIWLLTRYTDWLSKTLRPIEEVVTGKHRPTHRDELRFLLTHGAKESNVNVSERKMLKRILDFSRTEVRKVLIPLINVDALDEELTVRDALKLCNEFGHSRYPVFSNRIDNMVGIIHIFDLFSCDNPERPLRELIALPHYAPESQSIDELLYTMQKQGDQMAIVIDEYGGTVGVITIEDILEEIVGEIEDEYDIDPFFYKEVRPGQYLVRGRSPLNALADKLNIHFPAGDYETLSGFLFSKFDRIPSAGESIDFEHYRITIKKASERTLEWIEICEIDSLRTELVQK